MPDNTDNVIGFGKAPHETHALAWITTLATAVACGASGGHHTASQYDVENRRPASLTW